MVSTNDAHIKRVCALLMGVVSVACQKRCRVRGVVLTETLQNIVVGFGGVLLGGVRCCTGFTGSSGIMSAGARDGS